MRQYPVSVVIPTFNRSVLLHRTLTTLANQSGNTPEFEVVVADDGSTEDIRAVCGRFEGELNVQYVRQARNGFRAGAARNLGAKAARGAVIVFLDCGTLAGPRFVQGHAKLHAGFEQDVPSTWRAVMAPTYGYDVEPQDRSWVRALFLDSSRELRPQTLLHVVGMRDYRDLRLSEIGFDMARLAVPWRFFWSRNISLRREVHSLIGGFDESFTEYGVEDIEFGYRLYRSGVRFAWAPEPWAAEVPDEDEDRGLRAGSNGRNLRRLVSMYADAEVDFYVANRPLPGEEQVEFDALGAWQGSLGEDDGESLVAEFGEFERPCLVVGAGGGFRRPQHDVFCLDPTAPPSLGDWDRREAPSRPMSGFGFRTGFRDERFRSVLLTRRLTGIWAQWGGALKAEASRVGGAVLVSHSLADVE